MESTMIERTMIAVLQYCTAHRLPCWITYSDPAVVAKYGPEMAGVSSRLVSVGNGDAVIEAANGWRDTVALETLRMAGV